MKSLYLFALFITVSLYAQKSVRYIAFTDVETNAEHDSINWTSGNKIRHEFKLKGRKPIRCALTIIAGEGVVISQYSDKQWQTIDTLGYSVFPARSDYITPAFTITDFNKDGAEDFMFWSHTNVNGNDWEQIFLTNTATGRLQKLRTTPDEEDVWCDPEYNPKTKIINCTEVSGVYGVSAEYTYKLEGFTAIPLKKQVQDNTQIDATTGEGTEIRKYKGENSKWKLIETN